jgi:hypothetical protein
MPTVSPEVAATIAVADLFHFQIGDKIKVFLNSEGRWVFHVFDKNNQGPLGLEENPDSGQFYLAKVKKPFILEKIFDQDWAYQGAFKKKIVVGKVEKGEITEELVINPESVMKIFWTCYRVFTELSRNDNNAPPFIFFGSSHRGIRRTFYPFFRISLLQKGLFN